VAPYDGLVTRAGEQVELGYEIGCTNHKTLPRLDSRLVSPSGEGARGFTIVYYNSLDLSGEPVYQATTRSAEHAWLGEVAPGVQPQGFSARLRGRFTPQESGAQAFGLSSAGLSRLFVDGREVIDNWTSQTRGDTYFGTGSTEVVARVEMLAGQSYELRLDYSSQGATLLAGVRLGYLPPVAEDSIERAAALAARSDVALLFVGLNSDWESEGHDRADMELAGEQAALIERVAAANPNTVVVLQTGAPVAMPWLDQVAGVIQAWYPGQECGNAIADVLFGDVTPSGKLPQTFPRRLEDNPAFVNYPGENGRVRYGEGLFVGYRYYEKKRVEPLFPFGFGLSYTSFAYTNMRLSAEAIAPGDRLLVNVDVTNSGPRVGQEVVQLYVQDVASRLVRPLKELKGFAKVALDPGETKTVRLALDRAALAYWDDSKQAWVAEAGEFVALLGSSSQDIRAQAGFRLIETAIFGGPAKPRRILGIHSTVRELLEDDAARAVLERHFPEFIGHAQLGMAMGLSLAQVAGFAPGQFSEERLRVVGDDLAVLSESG
jgi:beta-glucosidase